jgi:hypothetical protein
MKRYRLENIDFTGEWPGRSEADSDLMFLRREYLKRMGVLYLQSSSSPTLAVVALDVAR